MRTRTVSLFFGLGKTQGELDFVDVPINGDISLFIDPDDEILNMLSLVTDGQRVEVDRFLTKLIDEVWYS